MNLHKHLHMKKILFFPILFFAFGYAQVGINTQNPDKSAVLDITSQNKGVLFPRISLQSLTDIVTVPNPTEGLVVWNTNASLAQGKGLFYFIDGAWSKISKQNSTTGKIYDFVAFKQTSSGLTMTAALQELTQLSTSYVATSDGNLFLHYIIYATLRNNANPRVSNVYCEIQVTDTTDSSIQKGSILVSPVLVIANQGSNAIATPSAFPVALTKGHTYNIKIFAREAYLDTSIYTVNVGTVNYGGNVANSSLTINSLLNP